MQKITISNPEKLLYPDDRITKIDVVEYYLDIAPEMQKFVNDRVLTAIRCHESIEKELFYKKHPQGESFVKTKKIGDETYFYINDILGLISQVQSGTLEFHTTPHPVTKTTKTSIMVFDLDPDKNLPLSYLQDGVLLLKQLLEEIGLTSFVKTSGGKGYHILVPFKDIKTPTKFYDFSKKIALLAEQKWPLVFTTNIKKNTRKNKIFIDYLRNNKTSSCVTAYSLRARKGVPISFPIAWDKIKKITPNQITIKNYKKYLNNSWKDFFKINQKIK